MKAGSSSRCLSSWRQPFERHTIQEVCSDLQDINLAARNGPNGYKPGNPFAYGCCVHRVQRDSASCLCVFRWINLMRCLISFFTACVSLRSENPMISNAELLSYLMLSLQWNLLLLLEKTIRIWCEIRALCCRENSVCGAQDYDRTYVNIRELPLRRAH